MSNASTTTPLVSVSLTQPPPSSMVTGSFVLVAATVTNDAANAGVDWIATCTSPPLCGSFSPAHTASGASTTYTAPVGVPSSKAVAVTAMSTTDHGKSSGATIGITSTVTGVLITQPPPTTFPSGASFTVAAYVFGDPANVGLDWTASCGGVSCTSGFMGGNHSAPGAPITFVVPLASLTLPQIVGTTVTLTAFAAADHSFSASASLTVTAPMSIRITQPPPGSMLTNASAPMIAVVSNDPSNSGVTWSIQSCDAAPCGSFSSSSILLITTAASGATVTYYAPPTAVNHVIIQAAATASQANAVATVEISIAAPVSITLSEKIPNSTIVKNKTAPLVATVSNDPASAGVNWTVTCASAGACGSFSPTHTVSGAPVTFTAPAAVPTGNTVTITATSTSDPTKSASQPVTVTESVPPDSLFSGQWILMLTGKDANGGPYSLGGAIDGDGVGNITGGALDLEDLGGAPTYNAAKLPVVAAPTSTYTVDTNGRGQIHLALNTGGLTSGSFGVNVNGSSGIILSVIFVTPQHALVSENDAFGSGTGTLDVQSATDLAAFQKETSSLNGVYSLTLSGIEIATSNPPYQLAGALTFQSSGAAPTETAYIADQSAKGVITSVAFHTVSHGFTNPFISTYGEMELDSVNLGVPTLFNLDVWLIDANHFVVTDLSNMFSTPALLVSGQMVAQPASAMVSGTYAFTENGSTVSPSFHPQVAGGIITCGSTGKLDVTPLGGPVVVDLSTSVLCAAPASGRGKISLLGTGGTGISRFSAYPTVDQQLFLMELDGGAAGTSGPSGSGVARSVTLSAPAPSAFAGPYAGNFLATTSIGLEGFVGQVDPDGTSKLLGTGIADLDSFSTAAPPLGTPSLNAVLSGTFTAPSDGRFPLVLTVTPAAGQPTPEFTNLNPACYIVDSTTVGGATIAKTCLLLGTDATAAGAGILELQNTGL